MPYLDVGNLQGKLIVIEGTDGVGRSSHITDIKEWLEVLGYGVQITSWTRSDLMCKAIQEAKAGHQLNVYTYSLFYLADLADRLEHEIIPALKAGFVVLADRYVYTAFARTIIRGADREWIHNAFGFALKPTAVCYMSIDIDDLIPRVINSKTLQERYWEQGAGEGLDYWESGMDLKMGDDFFDSFVNYQKRIIAEYDHMAKTMGFRVIDASRSFLDINKDLREGVLAVLRGDAPSTTPQTAETEI